MYILTRRTGCACDYYIEPIAVSHDKAKLEALAATKATQDKMVIVLNAEIDTEAKHIEIDRPFTVKQPETIKRLGKKAHEQAVLDYRWKYGDWSKGIDMAARKTVLERHNLPDNFFDTVCQVGAEYVVEEIEEL